MFGAKTRINSWLEVKALYRKHGLKVRLHNFIRLKTCPFEKITEFVSDAAEILDLGCGNGLFTNYLSLTVNPRIIIGIDISEYNIRIARQTIGKRSNISFIKGNLRDLDALIANIPAFSYILLTDTLYLLPLKTQEEIIRNCHRRLKKNGFLIVKSIKKNPLWKYYWCRTQDYFIVNVLRLHKADGIYILEPEKMMQMFQEAGFKNVKHRDLSCGYAYPHIIFIAQKTNHE